MIGRLLVAVALFGLASGGLFTVIGVRLAESLIPESWIGALSSVYFLGTLTGSATAGIILQRTGHALGFVVFALLATAGTACLVITDELAIWFVLRCLTGYAMGAYYVAIESWINHRVDNVSRGRSMALYECVRMGAIALSPLLLVVRNDGLAFLFAAGLFLVAIAPVGIAWETAPRLTRRGRLPSLQILKAAPLGAVACFIAGLLSSAFYGLGAVYASRMELTHESIILFMSVTWCAPLLAQIPIGILADRFGREWLLLGVSIVAASASLAIVLFGAWSLLLLISLAFVVGGFSHPLYALGVGLINDRVPRGEVLRAATTQLVSYSLGTSIGPTLASAAMVLLEANGLYLFFATTLLLLGLFVGISIVR